MVWYHVTGRCSQVDVEAFILVQGPTCGTQESQHSLGFAEDFGEQHRHSKIVGHTGALQ